MSHRFRRAVSSVFCLSLALQFAACTALRPRSGPPGAVAPRDFPSRVRLVLRDSTQVQLFQARIDGDTIRGTLANTNAAAVPAAEVVRWEGSGFSATRSLAAVGAVALIIGMLIASWTMKSV